MAEDIRAECGFRISGTGHADGNLQLDRTSDDGWLFTSAPPQLSIQVLGLGTRESQERTLGTQARRNQWLGGPPWPPIRGHEGYRTIY